MDDRTLKQGRYICTRPLFCLFNCFFNFAVFALIVAFRIIRNVVELSYFYRSTYLNTALCTIRLDFYIVYPEI